MIILSMLEFAEQPTEQEKLSNVIPDTHNDYLVAVIASIKSW